MFEEEDELNFEDSPDEEDGFISDVVRGGYDVSFAAKFIGHFSDYDEAEAALRDAIRKSQFYPNCWSVSDHGNYNLISVETNGNYFVQD